VKTTTTTTTASTVILFNDRTLLEIVSRSSSDDLCTTIGGAITLHAETQIIASSLQTLLDAPWPMTTAEKAAQQGYSLA